MTTTDLPTRAPDRPPAVATRRRLAGRLSTGHVLMLVVGVLAALANFAVLTAGQHTVGVLATRHQVRAGATLTRDDLRVVDLHADDQTLDGLLRRDELSAATGQVLAADLEAGALVRRSDLRHSVGADGTRRMSIPVPPERAVGGAISPGDRIDLVRVRDGVPAYLVSGARVVDVADRGQGTLGSLDRFSITIEIDPHQALCVAAAIDDGDLSVLLATGQDPVEVFPCVPAVDTPAVVDSTAAAGAHR